MGAPSPPGADWDRPRLPWPRFLAADEAENCPGWAVRPLVHLRRGCDVRDGLPRCGRRASFRRLPQPNGSPPGNSASASLSPAPHAPRTTAAEKLADGSVPLGRLLSGCAAGHLAVTRQVLTWGPWCAPPWLPISWWSTRALPRRMRQRPSTVLLALGTFFTIGTGLPLGGRLARAVSKSSVAGCATGWSHGPTADVVLSSGTELVFDQQDLPDAAKCVRTGALIEKVRWQTGYWIDGTYYPFRRESLVSLSVLCLLGLTALAFGAALRFLERRRGSGASPT